MAETSADKPHPWRTHPGRPYSGTLRRTFWTISRYRPGFPFNTETIMDRRGAKRFYDEAKAEAEAARLNAADGVPVARPINNLAEFCAEAKRTGLTAATLAEALSKRPEFADCLPGADGVNAPGEADRG